MYNNTFATWTIPIGFICIRHWKKDIIKYNSMYALKKSSSLSLKIYLDNIIVNICLKYNIMSYNYAAYTNKL